MVITHLRRVKKTPDREIECKGKAFSLINQKSGFLWIFMNG